MTHTTMTHPLPPCVLHVINCYADRYPHLRCAARNARTGDPRAVRAYYDAASRYALPEAIDLGQYHAAYSAVYGHC